MKKKMYTAVIPDETGMLALGGQIAQTIQQHRTNEGHPFVVFLCGQLGAGKTTFARGFLQGLGYEGRVKSPTYTLVEPYEFSSVTVFHFDLYRLHVPQELESMGIQDYLVPQAIILIEWPERGEGLLPIPDLSCYIDRHDNGREIKLIARSARGEIILQRLQCDE
jgi:tRNA threonylcarbamoyladenosine biosynthesis protein TsaE